MAEVLITLGIIGVVAAITIPNLMQKYQQKVLKTQFINKYAHLQQMMLYAKNDFGGNFKNYCTKYDAENNSYLYSYKCKEIFDKYFKVIGSCNYKTSSVTYNKSSEAYIDIGATYSPMLLLADGSCYSTRINGFQLGFTFDMNGADKGPNALGHDIFTFWVDQNDSLQPIKMSKSLSDDELEEQIINKCGSEPDVSLRENACVSMAHQQGYPCTKNSNQKGNGLGCSWYALNDKCPDDETKGYWECLPK